jgi:two-component system response regulator (stage 0 sporulation protein F)
VYSEVANFRRSAPKGLKSVLIVEDERSARRAMSLLFIASGYRPQAFGSAEEALAAMRLGNIPPIALVDLDLPEMNGLDFITQLEKLNPLVHSILITATDQETLAGRLSEHPVPYLRKPVNFDELLDMMADQQSWQ